MNEDQLLTRTDSGPLFTKQQYVLPPNLVKSQRREIGCSNDHIALKFDKHLGSTAAEMLIKFQSDWESLNLNLMASRLTCFYVYTNINICLYIFSL